MKIKFNSLLSSLKKALGVLFIGMMMTQGTKAQIRQETFLRDLKNHDKQFFLDGVKNKNLPLNRMTTNDWCDGFIRNFNQKSLINGWKDSGGEPVQIAEKDYTTVYNCLDKYCRPLRTGAPGTAWTTNTVRIAYVEVIGNSNNYSVAYKYRDNYSGEDFMIFDPSTCPMIVNPTAPESMFSMMCGQYTMGEKPADKIGGGNNSFANGNGGGNTYVNTTYNYNNTENNTSNPAPAVQKDNTLKYYVASVIATTLISGISYYLMRNAYNNQTFYVPQNTVGSTTTQTVFIPQYIPNVNYNSGIQIVRTPSFVGVGNNTIANVAPLSINQGSSAMGSNINSNVNYGTSAGTNYSYNNGNSGQGYQNYNNGNSGQQPDFTFGNGAYKH